MKNISSFYFVLLSIGCNQVKTDKYFIETNYNQIKYEIIEENKSEENKFKIRLCFTSNFNQDTIVLFSKDTIFIEEVIYTDHRIGIAKCITLDKSNQLKLSVNNDNHIDIGDLKKFNYLYISLNEKKECQILKTGKEKFFK